MCRARGPYPGICGHRTLSKKRNSRPPRLCYSCFTGGLPNSNNSITTYCFVTSALPCLQSHFYKSLFLPTVAMGSGWWIVKRDRLRLTDAADAQDQSGVSSRVSPPGLLRSPAIKYQYTSANIYAHAGGQSYGLPTIKDRTRTFSFSLRLVSLPLLLVFKILIYLFNDLEKSVPAVSCNTIKFLYHDSFNLCLSSSLTVVVFI